MSKKHLKAEFEIGDITTDVWAGDFVCTCEYLGYIGQGRMLFYDVTNKCFRRVYLQMHGGELTLNGWDCATRPSQLL